MTPSFSSNNQLYIALRALDSIHKSFKNNVNKGNQTYKVNHIRRYSIGRKKSRF